MSWITSWLPALPALPSLNISLPTGIQSRFLSFILRKALGHLLKPGQLDTSQIESQIGSGHVHVADLQLDTQAINELLTGLPVGLHSGTVGLITARVPWPNPLTSVVGFSLKSLHLTFHLLPKAKQPSNHPADLAESVVSVAESFVQEELSPDQEAHLRESFHSELAASLRNGEFTLPGGLGSSQEGGDQDVDPAGVSVFASMIESLLARFEFDAEDTSITLVHPGRSSLTVTLAELRYRTEDATAEDAGSKTRSVTLSGLTVTARNLSAVSDLSSSDTSTQAANSYMSTSTLQTPRRSPSPASSSSSLDDETQMAMSHSLAFLPPRPVSPTSSVASSMYQSALSIHPSQPDDNIPDPFAVPESPTCPTTSDPSETLARSEAEDLLISFGKEPIVLRLVTPPPSGQLHADGKHKASYEETLKFSTNAGVLACAFRAWHLRCMTDIVDTLLSHSAHSPLPKEKPPSTTATKIDVSAALRGVVILLLPSSSESETPFSTQQLMSYFDKPLIPPRLSVGFLRIQMERLDVSGSLAPNKTSNTTSGTTSSLELTLHEMSVFVFEKCEEWTKDFYASPILITDSHLADEYPIAHSHPDPIAKTGDCPALPMFKVVDWTNPDHHLNGMRLSQWRTKQRHNEKGAENTRALSATFVQKSTVDKKRKRETTQSSVSVSVAPLHAFLNLRQLVNVHVLGFVEELTRPKEDISRETNDEEGDADSSGEGSDSPEDVLPHVSGFGSRQQAAELERRRLERLVLKDLDLDYDYGLHGSPVTAPQQSFRRKTKSKSKDGLNVTLSVPMIRLQTRCPPPPGDTARSGPVIIDIHDLSINNGTSTRTPGARFADDPTQGEMVASVQLRRVLLATAGPFDDKAVAVLSLGSLSGLAAGGEEGDCLNPQISLVKLPSNPLKTSIVISVPSAYVNIHKTALDAIQYAIDDASQLVEVTFGTSQPDKDKLESREASIIGSRFFVKSRSGSDSSTIGEGSPPASTEDAIAVISVSEAFVRLNLPNVPVSSDEVQVSMEGRPVVFHESKPMDMYLSDVDVQLRPDGKGETAIVVNAMDLNLKNALPTGSFQTIIQLTAPRSLTSTPQSLLKLTFKSSVVPETLAKESRVKVALWGFTFNFHSDISWIPALASFFKAPPGAFESVVPTECTRIALRIVDGSIAAFTPNYPGCLVVHLGDLEFGTTLIGGSPDVAFRVSIPSLSLLLIDNKADIQLPGSGSSRTGSNYWKKLGFALLAELSDFSLTYQAKPADTRIVVEQVGLRLHLCADTGSALAAFIGDMTSAFQPPAEQQEPKPKRGPAMLSERSNYGLSSLDDDAFKRPPEIGPAPDMIYDDLPNNLDYLDDSFSAAAGLRELRDDDLEDFDVKESDSDTLVADEGGTGITSKIGGETIKMLRPDVQTVENYFDNLPPEPTDGSTEIAETTLRVQVQRGDVNVFLYDGYDWVKTRKTIEEGVKDIRRRLAKIRQLVANGQTQDPALEEETNTLLFNSVYVGLEHDVDEMEPSALLAAIDEELQDDFETISQSSWQSLKPQTTTPKPSIKVPRVQGKRLTRAKSPNIEFRVATLKFNVDNYVPTSSVVSKVFATIKELEILDHMKSSTWSKFLTSLRSDSRGNIRETDSDMVRVELKTLHPVPNHPSVEARLRAKILPLRLHVDQDALDFLKRFFSFEDSDAIPSPPKDPDDDIYFQFAEIFPVDLKLDYKPRRVDYRALKAGKTIELMNFFHFDGAEMTLRHITLAGISGWPRLFDLLNDLWTPDVKATQLVEVISGVAPIRSVVNVGSGIADLVLLPIAQYKKDGRIVRGMQKGATAFVKSTAIEAIKLGARLATGTQVILEQAEGVIGGQFNNTVTAETLQSEDPFLQDALEDDADHFSKYAEQPTDIKEGMQSAYRSLHRNFNSAAQTILAVPMEVYERSGNEGPVRSVIRAVPIAVLKPMIGASEAVSKTLLGLHNTLDPGVRQDNQAKYKQR